jgi:hypothetical protein
MIAFITYFFFSVGQTYIKKAILIRPAMYNFMALKTGAGTEVFRVHLQNPVFRISGHCSQGRIISPHKYFFYLFFQLSAGL